MTASALVLQMVRSHYAGNDSQFASASLSLARASKVATVRAAILNTVQSGVRGGTQSPRSSRAPEPMKPLAQKTSSLLQRLSTVTFADLLLEGPIQALLDEIVIELEYRDELAERKLRARNRLLFWGPPGNGKSSSAAALAEALGVPAYGVSLPRLIGSHIGETGHNLGKLFDDLRPDTVVVFDEIDALGARRGDEGSGAEKERNSSINTLLTLLDRCKWGVIVGTTNRPDMLDPALLRRFDESVEFPAPTPEQMVLLGSKLCETYGVDGIRVTDCRNFDEVQKRCETEARRIVMREILAAEEAAESEAGEQDGDTQEEVH
jgi:SpoVK/Ycf46/Vps4 family AAA+-type ATPase